MLGFLLFFIFSCASLFSSNFVDLDWNQYLKYHLYLFSKYSKDCPIPLCIEVPVGIEQSFLRPDGLLICKGYFGNVASDWIISSSCLQKLQFTYRELHKRTVNILDRIADLIPKEGQSIALITTQNGINTKLHDFTDMSRAILSKVIDGMFYIGIYNASSGLSFDLQRLADEKLDEDTLIVLQTRQFFEEMIEKIDHTNPNLLWLHIAHSEGGLIAHRAICYMNPDKQRLMKKHFIYLGLAPIEPLSNEYVFKAWNIYSNKDKAVLRFVKQYKHDPKYNIEIVKTSSRNKRGFVGDHAFLGRTYQQALYDYIELLKREYGFVGIENY